ncbi:hypothetical protein JCM17478_21210 [Thermopirellula anaerolimosa]
MNRPEKIPMQWSQELADLLVDGELAEEARREFLSRLDSTDDGWRRLAMTFLEAQAWRQSMGELLAGDRDTQPPFRESEDESAPTRFIARAEKASAFGPRWAAQRWVLEVAALAAVFMIALVLGRWLGQGIPRTGPSALEPRVDLAGNSAISPATPTTPVSPVSPAENGPQQSVASPWRLVSVPLGVGPDGAMTMVDLPVLDSEHPTAASAAPPGPYLPLPQFVDSLRQSGHAVEHQRQYVPVDMPDGSRTVFPVDNLQIKYVGNRNYQ